VEHSCRTLLSTRLSSSQSLTLTSILGLGNIENYNFKQPTVIKSAVSVVVSRGESFCMPFWRCLKSRRWAVDGNPCTGFPAPWKIWKKISVKFTQV